MYGKLLTCFNVFMTLIVLATFSFETTRDRSATRIKRMYSCCISANFSAKLVLAQTSLLLFSVSSRTIRIRLSHSCVCKHHGGLLHTALIYSVTLYTKQHIQLPETMTRPTKINDKSTCSNYQQVSISMEATMHNMAQQ